MLNLIGSILLILLMLLIAVVAVIDAFNELKNDDYETGIIIADIITFLAGIIPLEYFIVSRETFIVISIVSSIVVVACAIANGIYSRHFHIMHHVIRIIILGILLTMIIV
ncbi:hypothetical protein WR164_01300 [Philodulcilactobacillus myokoensis]|uniref:Uncharacterized protein n=1 Tax=Philodulcilactobacillus myokoensis TaxID=2929573 RepID=A0A9W6AZM0_9LACO|nr:hypothetical protein [Philodulcilactobacillus myokoensis]GLB46151.1 hypothetical protein WR164_01300 [Philodulcilactobacillus myokoensis]